MTTIVSRLVTDRSWTLLIVDGDGKRLVRSASYPSAPGRTIIRTTTTAHGVGRNDDAHCGNVSMVPVNAFPPRGNASLRCRNASVSYGNASLLCRSISDLCGNDDRSVTREQDRREADPPTNTMAAST